MNPDRVKARWKVVAKRAETILPVILCLLVSTISFFLMDWFVDNTVEYIELSLLTHGGYLVDSIEGAHQGEVTDVSISGRVERFAEFVKHELTIELHKWTYVWLVLMALGMLGSCLVSIRLGSSLEREKLRARQEQKERERIFQAYKKVIQAVTQNSIMLITPEELDERYAQTTPLLVAKISKKQDIAVCRELVDDYLRDHLTAWANPLRNRVLICLSEAVTNVYKHTPGGQLEMYLDDKELRFHVIDTGKGLDLEQLPYMIFLKGFSTNRSLGYGFPIIVRYMSQVIVCPTEEGTTLILRADLDKMANDGKDLQGVRA